MKIRLSEIPPEGRKYSLNRKSGELNETLDDLLQYAEEEALDFINYGVMMRIRIARIRELLAQGLQATAEENIL
jgi:hypothetical protein